MSFLPEMEQDLNTFPADIYPHWGSHYEDNPPSINPALLQISAPALGFTPGQQEVLQEDQALGGQAQIDSGPSAQAQTYNPTLSVPLDPLDTPDAMQEYVGLPRDVAQEGETHGILERKPPKCHCGKTFTRRSTLERHIGLFSKKVPAYPCTECTSRQGKDGFTRKDHLVQHLKHAHSYNDAQLASQFPPRETRKYHFPTCHIKTCDYYRDSAFQDLPIKEQEANRPFEKTADYTKHMKTDHDWSPYPCKTQSCDKRDGKGFFNIGAFEKHHEKNHQGVALPPLKPQARAAKLVKCHGCQAMIRTAALRSHEVDCTRNVQCRYCNMDMEARARLSHELYCTQTVQCRYCNMDMEARARSSHEERCANAPTCYRCHTDVHPYGMGHHDGWNCSYLARENAAHNA